jgi:hypothetical protein
MRQYCEEVPIIPAVALAVILEVAGPPTNLINPVCNVLCTLTAKAGTVADAKVTPVRAAG